MFESQFNPAILILDGLVHLYLCVSEWMYVWVYVRISYENNRINVKPLALSLPSDAVTSFSWRIKFSSQKGVCWTQTPNPVSRTTTDAATTIRRMCDINWNSPETVNDTKLVCQCQGMCEWLWMWLGQFQNGKAIKLYSYADVSMSFSCDHTAQRRARTQTQASAQLKVRARHFVWERSTRGRVADWEIHILKIIMMMRW